MGEDIDGGYLSEKVANGSREKLLPHGEPRSRHHEGDEREFEGAERWMEFAEKKQRRPKVCLRLPDGRVQDFRVQWFANHLPEMSFGNVQPPNRRCFLRKVPRRFEAR